MSDAFVAGFSSRHQISVTPSESGEGFAPVDLGARARPSSAPATGKPAGPKSFAPRAVGPKHFSPAPAEPDAESAGWDGRSADPHAFVDPVERARAQGFEEGVAHARALAEAERERDVALIQQLAARLSDAGRLDRDAIAEQLRTTVLALVRQMVGAAPIDAEHLAARAEGAVALIAEAAESAVLRLHPDDVALVRPHLPSTLHAVADEQVARGHFVLEAAATLIEDGPSHWLDQLAQTIDRVALPQ